MGRINGFFGYVKHNDFLSIVTFLGFLLAAQILAVVLLFLPLLFLDSQHSPLALGGYLERYAPIVLVGSIVAFAVLFFDHVRSVQSQLGYRYLQPNENRQLATIVETLALTAGIQVPKIGIIESRARNAFACGLHADNAVVVVTRGLLETLNRDELEAVIAHEITHIMNGDIRLIAAANVMMSCLEFANKKNPFVLKGWWKIFFLIFMPVWYVISALMNRMSGFAMNLGKVSRLVIASSREYVADAEAVRLTHKPAALISALRRIENQSAIEGLNAINDAMMIDGATMGSHATHPTIAERIAAIAKLSDEPIAAEMLAPSAPVYAKPPQQAVPLPKASAWQRLNSYLDKQDAKESKKHMEVPKSLFERVKTVEEKDTRLQQLAKRAIPWMMLVFAVSVVWGNLFSKRTYWDKVEMSLQPDGTYLRNGEKLTAEEKEQLDRQLRNHPKTMEDNAPTTLLQETRSADIGANGLRGRTFEQGSGEP